MALNIEAWAEWQRQFGRHLRTPLGFETGRLETQAGDYDGAFLVQLRSGAHSAAERLGAYNAQYWYRLFTVLHTDLPLTSHLVGLWWMNQLCSRYLQACPPKGNLNELCFGMLDYVREHEQGLPRRELVLQAIALDLAYHQVFFAPESPALNLQDADGSKALRFSPSCVLFEEDWPLVQLRESLDLDNESPLPTPDRKQCTWLVYFQQMSMHTVAIEGDRARLLARLWRGESLDGALLALEQEAHHPELLPEMVQSVFQQGATAGWWCGWVHPQS